MKSIFIENDNSESKGYRGEKILFDAIKEFFSNRECIAKHGYLMNFLGNKFTIEADTILFDKSLELIFLKLRELELIIFYLLEQMDGTAKGYIKVK